MTDSLAHQSQTIQDQWLKQLVLCNGNTVPYKQKFWHGIKFGNLANDHKIANFYFLKLNLSLLQFTFVSFAVDFTTVL